MQASVSDSDLCFRYLLYIFHELHPGSRDWSYPVQLVFLLRDHTGIAGLHVLQNHLTAAEEAEPILNGGRRSAPDDHHSNCQYSNISV